MFVATLLFPIMLTNNVKTLCVCRNNVFAIKCEGIIFCQQIEWKDILGFFVVLYI